MSEYRLLNDKNGADDRPAGYVHAHFFMKDDAVDEAASEKAGKVVYKPPLEWVIITIGDGAKASRTQHHVTDYDRERYPEHYKAFKAQQNQSEVIVGTPLRHWPVIPKEMVSACERIGVRSIEALRDCGVDMLDKIGPGAVALRDKAIAHLQYAENSGKAVAELAALRRSDEEKDAKLREMAEQIAALQSANREKQGKNKAA